MKITISFSLLTLLIVCSFSCSERATKTEREETWKNAHFEEHIAVSAPAYNELVKFLEQNIDTIISYRTHGDLGKWDCYAFFQGNINYDIKNVPNFLKAKLDIIYNSLGDDNIRQFEICKDKKISIEVRADKKEKGLYISHWLLWNTRMENNNSYSDTKDTLLSKDCIYRLEIKQTGH